MAHSSSILLAKLERINWCYTINATLQGVETTLLVKYVLQDNAYAIMLSDFSCAYFECLACEQIEQHYTRFNPKAKRISYTQIMEYLSELIRDMRVTSSLCIEQLQVDCHTSRVTIKTSKMFRNLKLNWTFYAISVEPEIYLKHLSLPMWRGLMHYYNLSQSQNSHDNKETNNSGDHNHSAALPLANTKKSSSPFLIDKDAMLKDLFR